MRGSDALARSQECNSRLDIMNVSQDIYVTQPSLPPLEDYVELLRDIWDRKWLTNNGSYNKQFEAALAEYLGVKYVSLFCNGTIALQVGLQALQITGEVITTPFSFPATTHALWWNHCAPVFGDIDRSTCNLDPAKIESLITKRTTAILPVHVYGNPCDVIGIQRVADDHGLKVFYDAAHAFGVRMNGQSILQFGDLSMISFHATKILNTAEGGALVTNDARMKERIDYLKNFGFTDETSVVAPGTNGKMNELQAALGLLQLQHVDDYIAKHKVISGLYRSELTGVEGLHLMDEFSEVESNDSYFPVFVEESGFGKCRDRLFLKLKEHRIYSRRYFYPLISSLPLYAALESASSDRLPIACGRAKEVLCLPIYAGMSTEDVYRIVAALREIQMGDE